MVWIYLAESEECQSDSVDGLDQLLTVKSIHIVKQCLSHEFPMDYYLIVLSGIMLRHCGEKILEDLQTSFMEGFHARISALQEMEKAWKEREADYFSRSCDWPKKLSHDSYSLKMFQPLPKEEEFKLLKKLPRWGMIVDGVLYPLQALERYTLEKDGFYWPTPTAKASMDC